MLSHTPKMHGADVNTFVLAGGILALIAYLPLWWKLWSGSATQNLATWILWTMLDCIIAASIIFQDGNFLLSVMYAIGSAITVLCIVRSGVTYQWSWLDTLTASLVLGSMLIWYFSGDAKTATVASTGAIVIAGIPQLSDAWKNPRDMPILVFWGYLIANCLSAAGGASWGIEARIFPTVMAMFSAAMILIATRRLWFPRRIPRQ